MDPKKHPCSKCILRAMYDKKPDSIIGRFWRWHIKYCPGWKSYFKLLDDNSKEELIKKYGLK